MSTDVVELRVHGVSGMRAEDILDSPIIARVAGDNSAGFYRARPGVGDIPGPAGTIPEGVPVGQPDRRPYRPDGVAAAAVAAVPVQQRRDLAAAEVGPARRRGRRHAVPHPRGCITAMFVLSMGVSMDLVGWQCALDLLRVPGYPGTGPPGHVDERLRDPRGLTVGPMDTIPPPIEGHWPHHTDPAYADAIAELIPADDSHGVYDR